MGNKTKPPAYAGRVEGDQRRTKGYHQSKLRKKEGDRAVNLPRPDPSEMRVIMTRAEVKKMEEQIAANLKRDQAQSVVLTSELQTVCDLLDENELIEQLRLWSEYEKDDEKEDGKKEEEEKKEEAGKEKKDEEKKVEAVDASKKGKAAVAPGAKKEDIEFNMTAMIWTTKGGTQVLKLTNNTGTRQAIKLKCSDHKLYVIKPVFSSVEPGKTAEITVVRSEGALKADIVVVCTMTCTEDDDKDLAAFFKKAGNGVKTVEISQNK